MVNSEKKSKTLIVLITPKQFDFLSKLSKDKNKSIGYIIRKKIDELILEKNESL
jgi:hypothetical protein